MESDYDEENSRSLWENEGDGEKMDKKKKKVQIEVPYRRVPEVQTYMGISEEEKQYARKHPESIYTGSEMTDVLGSYTGIPADKYDKPVQDADDL